MQLFCGTFLLAHPLTFNSSITYSTSQPPGASGSASNWMGAAFDAANVGGSGTNAAGGANNGLANDSSTYVANNQPRQGQSITTGSNTNGYDVASITVRMAGYTNNVAGGANNTGWDLNLQNGPIVMEIGKVSASTNVASVFKQNFLAGGTNSPGAGSSANGPGAYITFNLPSPVHLEPNTTYAFDLCIGNNGGNYFEWLGTSASPYAGGTAYTRSGATLTPLAGDRVFMVNMVPSAAPYAPFAHPGALHTAADFARMAEKVASGAQPWKADYDILAASPWAQTWWPAYDIDYINRGGAAADNYTRSQQDAQAIYELALMWKITGNTAYADHAVAIANVWSGLLGITGDTNASLAAGICGYLFAIGGEVLSTYPGWAAADKQAYKDMMMRVFYPANWDFLWRHHDTFATKGGNTHYRLNWDVCNAASMAAIGILCDNKAVYQQAIDYFKYGAGNGRVERAAWYIHPDGMAQTEEIGRDQGHNLGGWYSMALLCQMAWNQGDDLYGYDNNRVLRAFEACAKYNLGNEVPWVYHRNTDLAYTETLSSAGRGLGGYPFFEQVYNHYVNVRGMAAPWCKLAAEATRPEPRPHPEYHPSQVDWLGLGTLAFTRDPIASGAAPSGLAGNWSKNQVTLNWWGSAYATAYNIKRSTASGGPYATIGAAGARDLTYADTTAANGGPYYYVVSATTPTGETANSPEWTAKRALVTQYTFENTFNDALGSRNATAMGGSTGATGFATGKSGKAASFDGSDDYLQLPAGTGNYQDITISAWVYWNGGGTWQRVFDFGSEIEKFMMLTVNAGSNLLRFTMTTSRGTDGTLSLTGPAMPTATWTHVAVTLNGDTATMYVDGKPVASAASDGRIAPLFGQPFCYLGKSMYNGDPLFSGRIDDFRVYNYGLTGKEVYAAAATGGSNSAPSFAANPLARGNAAEDVAYSGQTLAGSATDANGGALAYSKVTGPSWLTVASNGALSGTPGNSDVGSNLFVVRVTDGSGATDDANLYIAVANANDAPTWGTASLARPDVTRGQPLVAYTVAGEASDVDAADTITYSKASGPSWLAVAADGTLSGTPSAGDVGANAFTVRVTDGAGAYSDATLTVNVLPYMLRSQYAFEDNTDDSAGGFNGAATGTPAYGLGRIGRGLVFDGTDDHVTLPAAAADYQDFTVAAWVYWTGGSAWQRIFDFGDDTTHYMFLTPKSETGLRFAINNGGTEEQVNCAAALPSGQWVHVAVTLGGNTAKLYLNGAAVATNSSITVHPGDFKPALNYIGKSHFADPLFGGTVDDFRIYNYATTAAEIAAMINIVPSVPLNVTVTPRAGRIDVAWNASQGATSYTVKRSTASGSGYTTIAAGITGGSYPDTSVANGMTYYYIITASNGQGESAASGEAGATASDLLAWLKFNETSGTAASDASGNGWNATLVNSPSWVSGIYAGGVRLTAASSQYLTLPSGIVSGLTDFTVSGWVNVSAFNTWQRIFDFGTGTTNYMFLTTQYTTTAPNSAKFRFAIRTPSVAEQQLSSSVAVGTNAWVHYAVTLSNTTAKLYINGAPVATNAATTLRPSSLGTTTLNYLGKSQWADPYLDGSLDDFRIHTRALSAAEIAAAAAPSPAAPQELLGAPGDGSVALNWSHENLTSSYSVKRAAARGGPYTTLATGLAGTAYTDTTASNGTTYFYVVTGSNAQGESASSPEAVVTPFQARFRPYSADANTPVLVHFAETAGGSAATNSGALGKNFYSVDLTNAASPVVVTTSIGNTAGYSGFGNAANITSAGCVLGWDANGNGTYNADVSSASLSADRTNMSALNIGNGGQSPWTVEAMVYCTLATLNTNQEILCTDSSATSRGFQFRISSAAELELNFINGTSSGTADIKTAVPTTGANAYAANAWFHVAATYDGTNARLYWTKVSPTNKAANLISTTAVGVGTSAGSLTGPLCVGNENRNNAGENLRGYVDEVRISSVCRSANDFYWQADPDAPTNLSSTAGDAQVALTWTAAAGAAGYYVKRSTAVGGPYAVIATSFGTSYTDLTAANGETYHYVVTAINGAGESSASPSSTASPVSALLSSVGPGSILFTGINSSDPDRFAFVAMQELPGSMAITFTDNAWTGSALANSEGKLVYTTPAAGLAAGSRVVIERGSGGNSATVLSGGGSVGVPDAAFSLDPAGDNLFACMGTSPNPTFLAGALTAVPLTAGATSTSQTYVPSAIAEATVYLVASGGVANAAYAGSTTGVKALVAASLVDPADWAMSAAAPIPDGSAFVFIESQVEQAVAFSALPAKTYGDASFALSAAASSGLPVRYESSDTSVASVSGNMLTVLRAGSATISAAQPGNPQYAAAAPVQRTLAVSPKALSITADAKSKTYGQADPALTYSSSGLLGQDAIAGSLSRELGENAGAYAIAQGSLTAGADYSISFTGANLTVSAAPLPEIGWGGAEVANAGSVASFSYAYTGRSSGGVSTSFSGSTPPASAGYYTAIATSTDSNYAGSSTNSFFVSGPVAADDAVSRPTATMNIPKATLLQNDLRIDSSGALQTNGLTITAVAAGAGSPTVSLNGAFVSFAPSSQTGAETFTYTLGDGIKTATATVTVTPYADLSNDPFGITGTSRGSHIGAAAYDSGTGMTEIPVTFSGTPNVTYWVQYTGEIGQPWKNAGGWFSENGTFQVTIQEQGNHAADWNGSMFFRATR